MPPELEEPVWYFPFDLMEVGESFFVPTLKPDHMLSVIEMRAKVGKYKVRAYITRTNDVLGVRVWKIP